MNSFCKFLTGKSNQALHMPTLWLWSLSLPSLSNPSNTQLVIKLPECIWTFHHQALNPKPSVRVPCYSFSQETAPGLAYSSLSSLEGYQLNRSMSQAMTKQVQSSYHLYQEDLYHFYHLYFIHLISMISTHLPSPPLADGRSGKRGRKPLKPRQHNPSGTESEPFFEGGPPNF